MTYNATNEIYVSDVEASTLGCRAGEFPEILEWDDRLWEREAPQFGPEGELAAYAYGMVNDPDYPEVLMVWND